jgi:CheY-like chemotaxis protein
MTKPLGLIDLKKIFTTFEAKLETRIKEILITANNDDTNTIKEVEAIIKNDFNRVTITTNIDEAIEHLKIMKYECMIITNDKYINSFTAHPSITIPPIVFYSGSELSYQEKSSFRNFSNKHVLVNACSKEKILDEVNLFLHHTKKELTPEQSNIIDSCHDNKTIFKGRHILLVDDDMRNIFSLSKVLKKEGLIVTIAENGQVALDKLTQDSKIDLVLMDIMMPIMDGHTAIKKIRERSELNSLPVIALTANAMKGDKEICLQSGANDYLSKPVDIEKLFGKLRDYLFQVPS